MYSKSSAMPTPLFRRSYFDTSSNVISTRDRRSTVRSETAGAWPPGPDPERTRPTGWRVQAPKTHRSPQGGEPMISTRTLVAAAVAAAIAMPFATMAQGGPAPKPKFESEKCYGITKAGKNDCQTANSSCAGTSRRDAQGDAWLYVPKGACEKVVNGSLQPKKA